MKNYSLLIMIMSAFILAGCETTTPLHMPDKDARMHYLKMNPVDDPYISSAIKKGKVVPGMTKEQVLSIWGEPALRGIGRWEYRGLRNIYILFKDGIVTSVNFYT